MPTTTHAEHFLQRIDRLDVQQAELALGLYRDPDLLRFVLAKAELPPGEERVAVALADGNDGPHVIVTRDGKFVTCLGRGMRPHEDQPIVARHTLDQLSTKIDALRHIVRAAENGGRHACDTLMKRALQAGNTLTQEHFDDLVAWAPLLGHQYLVAMHQVMENQHRAFQALTRVKNVRKAPERLVHGYWESLWGTLHMATLVGHEPESLQWLFDQLDQEEESADSVRWSLLKPLWQARLLGWGLRGAWLAARLPKAFLKPLKDDYTYAREPTTICALGCTLAAIGHRHKRLRAEISKALRRGESSGSTSDGRESVTLGNLLVRTFSDGVQTNFHDIAQHDVDEQVRQYVQLFEGEPHAERLNAAPPSAKLAWMLSLPIPTLEGEHLGLERSLLFLPAVSRMEARDFYVPEEYGPLLPFGGYHRDIALAFVEPRLGAVASLRPPPVRAEMKPGRNEPCSCGSGKKYKRCCGAGR